MNATAPVPDTRAELPHPQEVAEQWRARAALYPEPTLDDVRADHIWGYARATEGALDPDGALAGLHVAVCAERVVGCGPDPSWLQVQLSRALDVHPARVVTIYLPE